MAATTDGDSVERKEEALRCDGLGRGYMWWRRRRFQLAFLCFVGFANLYAVRVNISVAIVDMVANRSVSTENNTVTYEQDFPWDSRVQSLVLSMFFYGYVLTQLAGGWLATRFGGARLVGIAVAGSVLLSVFTPPLACSSLYLLMAARVLMGCFQGMVMPAMNEMWVYWAPIEERSRLITITLSGCSFGTVIAMPASGIIASSLSWPFVFYIFGGLGLLWYAIWVPCVKNTPENDTRISVEELKYITERKDYSAQESKTIKTPWLKIFSSPPFIATVISHFAANYGLFMFLTELPTFMSDTLNFDLQKTGFLSALPHLVMCIVLQISGHLYDYLNKKKVLSPTLLRKLFLCGSFTIQAALLVLASYLRIPAAVALCLTMCLGAGALCYTALCSLFMDLSPLHSSILSGISSTVANLSGMIAPVVAGFIVRNKTAEEWRIVFFIAAAVYVTAALIFGVLGSSERQHWAKESVAAGDNNKPHEKINISETKDVVTHM
ncbi:sialin-like [Schistocerca americana]|uniref:sialin-like n=1 Tax=Schistocerca americana TaxID=7009 RepID=UPI001F4F1279|nr:sialin-like [Schistocerca americana]